MRCLPFLLSAVSVLAADATLPVPPNLKPDGMPAIPQSLYNDLAQYTDYRTAVLVDPKMSGLPPFLIEDSGLNSGFMILQVSAAALVSENKSLAFPASVDSIPTSAGQEDHVSMATHGALKARRIARNAAGVVGIVIILVVLNSVFPLWLYLPGPKPAAEPARSAKAATTPAAEAPAAASSAAADAGAASAHRVHVTGVRHWSTPVLGYGHSMTGGHFVGKPSSRCSLCWA